MNGPRLRFGIVKSARLDWRSNSGSSVHFWEGQRRICPRSWFCPVLKVSILLVDRFHREYHLANDTDRFQENHDHRNIIYAGSQNLKKSTKLIMLHEESQTEGCWTVLSISTATLKSGPLDQAHHRPVGLATGRAGM